MTWINPLEQLQAVIELLARELERALEEERKKVENVLAQRNDR